MRCAVVKAHVEHLVGQLTQIIADGVVQVNSPRWSRACV